MCCIGVFQGIKRTGSKTLQYKRVPFGCNNWACDECRPFKLKKLYARLINGDLVAASKVDGFRSKYVVKLLTLTCPGKEYRAQKTRREAYEEMTHSFDKLIRALKKRLGSFYYIRVREPQTDGFPHLHVLLVGINIAPIYVLDLIKHLWCEKYEMGFVKLNAKGEDQTIGGAIRYIFKYITKCSEFGEEFKGVRLYTASRGALEKERKTKHDWLNYKLQFGNINAGNSEPEVWDFTPGISIEQVPLHVRSFLEFTEYVLNMRLTLDGGDHG